MIRIKPKQNHKQIIYIQSKQNNKWLNNKDIADFSCQEKQYEHSSIKTEGKSVKSLPGSHSIVNTYRGSHQPQCPGVSERVQILCQFNFILMAGDTKNRLHIPYPCGESKLHLQHDKPFYHQLTNSSQQLREATLYSKCFSPQVHQPLSPPCSLYISR